METSGNHYLVALDDAQNLVAKQPGFGSRIEEDRLVVTFNNRSVGSTVIDRLGAAPTVSRRGLNRVLSYNA